MTQFMRRLIARIKAYFVVLTWTPDGKLLINGREALMGYTAVSIADIEVQDDLDPLEEAQELLFSKTNLLFTKRRIFFTMLEHPARPRNAP